MFDKKVKPNTSDGKKLQEIIALIKQYEDEHYPILSSRKVTFENGKISDSKSIS